MILLAREAVAAFRADAAARRRAEVRRLEVVRDALRDAVRLTQRYVEDELEQPERVRRGQ